MKALLRLAPLLLLIGAAACVPAKIDPTNGIGEILQAVPISLGNLPSESSSPSASPSMGASPSPGSSGGASPSASPPQATCARSNPATTPRRGEPSAGAYANQLLPGDFPVEGPEERITSAIQGVYERGADWPCFQKFYPGATEVFRKKGSL